MTTTPGTTTTGNPVLEEAIRMWKSISPVCTVRQMKGDEWNHELLWRGKKLGLLTAGDDAAAFTCSVQVDPDSCYISGVNMLGDDYTGGADYGRFVGKVSVLESMVRQWPTVMPDSVGNLRLMVGKGEYGSVEFTTLELRYRRVSKYDDKARKGRWVYGDLDSMLKFTESITSQIETLDGKKVDAELNSLMSL